MPSQTVSMEVNLNKQETYQVEALDHLPDSALVSVRAASAVSGKSPSTVWRRIRDGKLSVVRDGQTTRIKVGSLRSTMGAVRLASKAPELEAA